MIPLGVSGGRYGHHGSGIGAHLSANQATGLASAYGTVVLDATNDDVATVNASLAGGVVTTTSSGPYCDGGLVTFEALGGETGFGIQLVRDGVVVTQIERTGIAPAAGDRVPIPFCVPLDHGDPATVEVRAASFGAGGATVVGGRAFTFLSVAAV